MSVYFNQLAADNFNRANEIPIASPCVPNTVAGYGTLNLISDAVEVNNFVVQGCALYSGITWPNDQYSQFTNVHTDTGKTVACYVRYSTTADTGYALFNLPGGAGFQLGKDIAGVFTQLAVNATPAANGDVMTLAEVGTTLTAFKNGVQILTATDSSIASGSAGMYINTNAGTTIIDNWSGGSASNSPAPSPVSI